MLGHKSKREETVVAGKSGNGGDIVFTTGQPGRGGRRRGHAGDVVFKIGGDDGVEMLRLRHNGQFLVRGRVVETDREVYSAFRAWLAALGLWER